MAKNNELKYDHPPYSPDLASSDYYLFPNQKTILDRKRFISNEEAITVMAIHRCNTVVDRHFADEPELFYNYGIELLERRWTMCIEVEEDYIEKNLVYAKNNFFTTFLENYRTPLVFNSIIFTPKYFDEDALIHCEKLLLLNCC